MKIDVDTRLFDMLR